MARRRDPHTKDLFSWEPEPIGIAYADEIRGRGDLDSQISRVVAQALRDAKDGDIARPEVASRMAQWLGRKVTDDQLDKWASESTGDRRIPLDAFLALVHATGCRELLGFAAGLFGMSVVPDKYVDILELHQLEEHKREVEIRAAALQAKIRRPS